MFCKDLHEARMSEVFDEDEWNEFHSNTNFNDDIKSILQLYHLREYRKKYDLPIYIETMKLLNDSQIEKIQLAILHFMHNKEIVIETLPTSNVRIGHHQNFKTYHLWNWFKWKEEGKVIPPIVVGTDDTGIFTTNIYNEFANIYCYLIGDGKVTHNKALSIIERLNRDSLTYRFEKL